MARSRNWCFTEFNLELKDLTKIYNDHKDNIRYLCAGKETCPTSGKMHMQGWIQFEKPKRFGGVKKLFTKSTHIETCKGNEFDNDKYCKKDGEFITHGEFMAQGNRTDLKNIKKILKDGGTMSDIMEKEFETYCKYRNGIKDYAALIEKKNRKEFRKVEVEVLWGETGTGKTKTAMETAEFKIHADQLKWWDGYDGEKIICIDEYDSSIRLTEMLGLLDGYQLRLPIKGSFTYANWTKVIITSNLHPRRWHLGAKRQHKEALLRRITSVIEVARSTP